MREGCYYYFGITRVGKTTLALSHLSQEISATGLRALVLDCMPAANFGSWRHERDVDGVLGALCTDHRHAVYTPRDREDIDRIFNALTGAGISKPMEKTLVLWDECSIHMEDELSPAMSRALRGWAHTSHVFFLVSQMPGDLPRDCWITGPEVYVFRLERDTDLLRVEKDFKMPRAEIGALAKYEHRVYRKDRFA